MTSPNETGGGRPTGYDGDIPNQGGDTGGAGRVKDHSPTRGYDVGRPAVVGADANGFGTVSGGSVGTDADHTIFSKVREMAGSAMGKMKEGFATLKNPSGPQIPEYNEFTDRTGVRWTYDRQGAKEFTTLDARTSSRERGSAAQDKPSMRVTRDETAAATGKVADAVGERVAEGDELGVGRKVAVVVENNSGDPAFADKVRGMVNDPLNPRLPSDAVLEAAVDIERPELLDHEQREALKIEIGMRTDDKYGLAAARDLDAIVEENPGSIDLIMTQHDDPAIADAAARDAQAQQTIAEIEQAAARGELILTNAQAYQNALADRAEYAALQNESTAKQVEAALEDIEIREVVTISSRTAPGEVTNDMAPHEKLVNTILSDPESVTEDKILDTLEGIEYGATLDDDLTQEEKNQRINEWIKERSDPTTPSEEGTDGANGDASNGDTSNGDAPNGDAPNGDAPNGDAPNGDAPNGDGPNSDAANGNEPSGETGNDDGSRDTRDGTNGDAPLEGEVIIDGEGPRNQNDTGTGTSTGQEEDVPGGAQSTGDEENTAGAQGDGSAVPGEPDRPDTGAQQGNYEQHRPHDGASGDDGQAAHYREELADHEVITLDQGQEEQSAEAADGTDTDQETDGPPSVIDGDVAYVREGDEQGEEPASEQGESGATAGNDVTAQARDNVDGSNEPGAEEEEGQEHKGNSAVDDEPVDKPRSGDEVVVDGRPGHHGDPEVTEGDEGGRESDTGGDEPGERVPDGGGTDIGPSGDQGDRGITGSGGSGADADGDIGGRDVEPEVAPAPAGDTSVGGGQETVPDPRPAERVLDVPPTEGGEPVGDAGTDDSAAATVPSELGSSAEPASDISNDRNVGTTGTDANASVTTSAEGSDVPAGQENPATASIEAVTTSQPVGAEASTGETHADDAAAVTTGGLEPKGVIFGTDTDTTDTDQAAGGSSITSGSNPQGNQNTGGAAAGVDGEPAAPAGSVDGGNPQQAAGNNVDGGSAANTATGNQDGDPGVDGGSIDGTPPPSTANSSVDGNSNRPASGHDGEPAPAGGNPDGGSTQQAGSVDGNSAAATAAGNSVDGGSAANTAAGNQDGDPGAAGGSIDGTQNGSAANGGVDGNQNGSATNGSVDGSTNRPASGNNGEPAPAGGNTDGSPPTAAAGGQDGGANNAFGGSNDGEPVSSTDGQVASTQHSNGESVIMDASDTAGSRTAVQAETAGATAQRGEESPAIAAAEAAITSIAHTVQLPALSQNDLLDNPYARVQSWMEPGTGAYERALANESNEKRTIAKKILASQTSSS